MRVEIMPLIQSRRLWLNAQFACQYFSMCVSGHPEAARPDVQPSGLRGEALSLTLQTLNNAHRSLRLMSPLLREHGVRALPAVSIRASVSWEQSFLCLRWHRTRELDTKCKSALSSWRWLQSDFVTRCKEESDSFSASRCRMQEGQRQRG